MDNEHHELVAIIDCLGQLFKKIPKEKRKERKKSALSSILIDLSIYLLHTGASNKLRCKKRVMMSARENSIAILCQTFGRSTWQISKSLQKKKERKEKKRKKNSVQFIDIANKTKKRIQAKLIEFKSIFFSEK